MLSWQPIDAQVGVKISFWTRVNVAFGSIGSPGPPGEVGVFNSPHAVRRRSGKIRRERIGRA
jgi:hypothetical protein